MGAVLPNLPACGKAGRSAQRHLPPPELLLPGRGLGMLLMAGVPGAGRADPIPSLAAICSHRGTALDHRGEHEGGEQLPGTTWGLLARCLSNCCITAAPALQLWLWGCRTCLAPQGQQRCCGACCERVVWGPGAFMAPFPLRTPSKPRFLPAPCCQQPQLPPWC